MRFLFYIVHFSSGAFFLLGCLGTVLMFPFGYANPRAFLANLVFLPFPAGVVLLEWLGFRRDIESVDVATGVICLAVSALTVFSVIANVGEAMISNWPRGFGWFVAAGIGVAGYFALCGTLRIKWGRTGKGTSDVAATNGRRGGTTAFGAPDRPEGIPAVGCRARLPLREARSGGGRNL